MGSAHGENRGSRSRWLAGQFRPADGGLPGKVGPVSLPEPRGSQLRGSDGEGPHWSLAHDGDGGRRRGAPVRGRRSEGNPKLKQCRCTPGRSSAHGGRDGAGRWTERSVVCELTKEWQRRGTGDGSTGKWLRASGLRKTSTAG
jgi:hypothetical protein